MVSTLAGSEKGYADGIGSEARFDDIQGMTVDKAGNIFIADINNNAIRKITPDGLVSTFAGGTYGNANGIGTAAQFSGPSDIEMDKNGDFYVVEGYGNRIRKITESGEVTNFAGSLVSESGYVNAQGDESRFYVPVGIAIVPDGNIYVTEITGRIRKITPSGLVSTLAGNGTIGAEDGIGEMATFDSPYGIDADLSGNLFVVETVGNKLRKITPDGIVTTMFPGFTQPNDVAVDKQGNCFVANTVSRTVNKVTSDKKVSIAFGSTIEGQTDGPGDAASFKRITGIHFDQTGKIIYVSDNNRIRKIQIVE
jgi:hypothetical protein